MFTIGVKSPKTVFPPRGRKHVFSSNKQIKRTRQHFAATIKSAVVQIMYYIYIVVFFCQKTVSVANRLLAVCRRHRGRCRSTPSVRSVSCVGGPAAADGAGLRRDVVYVAVGAAGAANPRHGRTSGPVAVPFLRTLAVASDTSFIICSKRAVSSAWRCVCSAIFSLNFLGFAMIALHSLH